jgi:hypothetical protein
MFGTADRVVLDRELGSPGAPEGSAADFGRAATTSMPELARCFLRLANLPNFILDRLSHYEVTLWRQVDRTLCALDALDRRKPQERRRESLRTPQ